LPVVGLEHVRGVGRVDLVRLRLGLRVYRARAVARAKVDLPCERQNRLACLRREGGVGGGLVQRKGLEAGIELRLYPAVQGEARTSEEQTCLGACLLARGSRRAWHT